MHVLMCITVFLVGLLIFCSVVLVILMLNSKKKN